MFPADLLAARQDSFRAIKLDNVGAALDPGNGAGDEVADLVAVFLQDHVALGFPDPLESDLLDGLDVDAAEDLVVFVFDGADFHAGLKVDVLEVRAALLRLVDRQVGTYLILNRFAVFAAQTFLIVVGNDDEGARHVDGAVLGVDGDGYGRKVVLLLGHSLDALFQYRCDRAFVQAVFFFKVVD